MKLAAIATVCGIGLVFAVYAQVTTQAVEKPLPDNCFDLWKERNQYYADAHYCFKTARAKDEFKDDMRTCSVDDESQLRLTVAQQKRISAIIQRERAYGCGY